MSPSEQPIAATVWNENVHERRDAPVRERYPSGMHQAVADGVRENLGDRVSVRTATMEQPEHGLSEQVLADTDVLTWWGHAAHEDVADEVVDRVQRHVLGGMGLIVLHSGHLSKIFRRLMGTTCSLRWRNGDDRELVWTIKPRHPVAAGIPSPLSIPTQEMYGEVFDIPDPDELVFVSSFSGGEVFRSGCAFYRGHGRIFYFSPGDQEYPVYHQPEVRQVIANAVAWAAPMVDDRSELRLAHSERGWFEENPPRNEEAR